ncbi:YvrJ family protein [Gudongella sp.]
MEDLEDIYSSVANLGFPIVISVYLLVRIEGKLDELTKSITELANVIAK